MTQEAPAAPKPKKTRTRRAAKKVGDKVELYGVAWPAELPMWKVEAEAYRHYHKRRKNGEWVVPGRLPTRDEHFINLSNIFWGNRGAAKFIWHPWAEDMLHESIRNKFVGFAGSASSGKSRFVAVWGLINFTVAPLETLVMVTSTTIRDAKLRAWGAVTEYWNAGPSRLGIGKIVNSPTPLIYPINPADGSRVVDTGILLIPAEAKKTNEVTGKVRGAKANRVFLCADELSELSHALLDTAKTNLINNPTFHMIGAANPKSYLDPFGVMVRPTLGWNSICVEDTKWEIDGGVCLHFDALKNPNYVARENLWPIQKWEKIDDALQRDGAAESPGFWRDFRAFWCPTGHETAIYSEVEIIQFKAMEKAEWSGAKKIPIAGFDPNYSGGDRAVLRIGWFGTDINGQDVIEFGPFYDIEEDVTDKETARNFQIARSVVERLKEHNVDIRNLAVDATAGGDIFCDILANESGFNSFLRVQFGSKATDRPVSSLDTTPANQKYRNRVTEIWCVGLEYLRASQLKGMDAPLVRELTERKYETTRATSVTLMSVEPKIKMKARIGRSPDNADASVLLIDIARERFGLRSQDAVGVKGSVQAGGQVWRKAFRRFGSFSRSMQNRR